MSLLIKTLISFYKANYVNFQENESKVWIIDYGANQHMNSSSKHLNNVVDISDVKLTVGYPNGTQAKVVKTGSSWVLCKSLSITKLAKDSKLFVGFDEFNCDIYDLKQMNTVGTGRVNGELYLFEPKG